MIENFIDSALIIDEKKDEVEDLINLLESKDIWVKHYLPDELKNKKIKNRKMIFLDLYLDDTKTDVDNISSIIRPILKNSLGLDFGTYGIVLWTKHDDKIDEFKKRIQKDSQLYSLPLFVVGLDKTKYKREGNYNSLFTDLNKKLAESVAASFFIIWSSLVNRGKDDAIKNIYSLIKDFDRQNINLQYLLFHMAKNYTGIPLRDIEEYPLYLDAYRTFNNMMTYEIISNKDNASEIFKNLDEIRFISENLEYSKSSTGKYFFNGTEIDLKVAKNLHDKNIGKLNNEIFSTFSKINSILLFDEVHIKQNKIVPGNIYEIVGESPLTPENIPNDATPIIIEVSPPCDYSQEKMRSSKVLGGFISKYSGTKYKDFGSDYFYKEIWPVFIEGFDNPSIIMLDHRYYGALTEDEIKDDMKYKILFRVKDKLFADILQKLTSYNARLGLSIIRGTN